MLLISGLRESAKAGELKILRRAHSLHTEWKFALQRQTRPAKSREVPISMMFGVGPKLDLFLD